MFKMSYIKYIYVGARPIKTGLSKPEDIMFLFYRNTDDLRSAVPTTTHLFTFTATLRDYVGYLLLYNQMKLILAILTLVFSTTIV